MTILDLILLLVLFFFVFSGLYFGLIHTLGALLGTMAGVLVAGHYFEQGAQLILPVFMGNENLARIVAFVIIFILSSRLVGLVFWLVDKIFKIVSIIPFLKSINRLLGAILGFLEGAIVLGLALIFITKFPFAAFVGPAIEGSKVAEWLVHIGKILLPLLPEVVRQIKGILPL